MKKKNQLRTIAGQDFLFSSDGAIVIDEYLGRIGKKYRIYYPAKRELREALRDMLISLQGSQSKNLSKATCQKAVAIVGDTYEKKQLLFKVLQVTQTQCGRIWGAAARLLKNSRTRTVVYYGLAFVFFALCVWSATLLMNSSPPPHGIMDASSDSIQTSIGRVQFGIPWPNSAFIQPPASVELYFDSLMLCAFGAVLFVILAKKSRYWKIVLPLFVVSLLIWPLMFAQSRQKTAEYLVKVRTEDPGVTSAIEKTPTINDIDHLLACGARIRYDTSGELFYDFRDAGYKLGDELTPTTNTGEPAHAELCSAYNDLRKTYPNENIVLQRYLIDDSGERRPNDGQEIYVGLGTPTVHINQFRYGFFVKQN